MLPDKSVLIGQKWVENAKIQTFKCDILSDFQTICAHREFKLCSVMTYLSMLRAIHLRRLDISSHQQKKTMMKDIIAAV